jgi:predicted MFS family arabinose efflux permease
MLSGRFGSERVLMAGLGLMAVGGLFTSGSTSLAEIVAARLVSGTGAVLMNVAVTRMAADWFAGREIGTAMAVLVSSWPLGLALGLVGTAPLAAAFGWKTATSAATLFCIAAMLMVWALYRPADHAAGETVASTVSLTKRECYLILLAGLIWGVYNVAYIVLVSFLPSVLTARGYELSAASGLVSLLGWALIPLVPLGGYLADRSGRPELIMMLGLLVTAAAAILMSVPGFLLVGFVCVLLAGGLPAGALMALPIAALRSESRAVGMGLYFSCYYGCMAIFPAIAGWTRDLTGNDLAPVLFAAAMLGVAVGGLGLFLVSARGGTTLPHPS